MNVQAGRGLRKGSLYWRKPNGSRTGEWKRHFLAVTMGLSLYNLQICYNWWWEPPPVPSVYSFWGVLNLALRWQLKNKCHPGQGRVSCILSRSKSDNNMGMAERAFPLSPRVTGRWRRKKSSEQWTWSLITLLRVCQYLNSKKREPRRPESTSPIPAIRQNPSPEDRQLSVWFFVLTADFVLCLVPLLKPLLCPHDTTVYDYVKSLFQQC